MAEVTIELDFEPMDEIIGEQSVEVEKSPSDISSESLEDKTSPNEHENTGSQSSLIDQLHNSSISSREKDRKAIEPPESDSDKGSDEDDSFGYSKSLAKRLKRVRNHEDYDRLSESSDRAPMKKVARQEWGLEPATKKESVIQNGEIARIYASLGVDLDDNRLDLKTIFVKGVDSMNEYDIEKIFAEFGPIPSRNGVVVRFVNQEKSECVISFKDLYKVVEVC